MELRRIGRKHEYEVYAGPYGGQFAGIVSRACYTRLLGATWVVTMARGFPAVDGTFKSRKEALEAVKVVLGPEK
jgi:hypothetical protein